MIILISKEEVNKGLTFHKLILIVQLLRKIMDKSYTLNNFLTSRSRKYHQLARMLITIPTILIEYSNNMLTQLIKEIPKFIQ